MPKRDYRLSKGFDRFSLRLPKQYIEGLQILVKEGDYDSINDAIIAFVGKGLEKNSFKLSIEPEKVK